MNQPYWAWVKALFPVSRFNGLVPPSILRPGQLLEHGRYRVELRIALGGLGEVWRGLDLTNNRPVVFKTVRAEQIDDPETIRMFLAEAAHGQAVNHPGVVQTLGRIEDDIPPPGVIVQEFADGRSLAQVIGQTGALEAGRALKIGAKVARALRAVHNAGLVHRDVSAVNLILDRTDSPKLIDFGITVPIGSPSVTQNLTVPGNPEYLAPELTRGRPATEAADIYSLGIVMFEALTGVKPFSRASREGTATAHVTSPSPIPPNNLPSDLRSFLLLLVAKDPTRRPHNALAVARLLEAWAG
jgi:serine/threonine-protein kinase